MADNEIRLNVTAVESEPLNVCVTQTPMNPVNVENTYKGLDYNLLKNKPSIDGVTLEGDKTTAEVIGFDKEYVDDAILATNAKIDEVSSREGYSKKEIDDKLIVIEADIDAQADAIQKTRSDFMESDSELQQQINAHAEELTTQKNDIDELGDQVAGIESKIPEGTSDTNPLINKQQLLDEEMDIRSDFNESVSELQTQITAQASAIANKVDATGDTMTGALNLPELNVATSEGTLNLSITAGVATIATNNGLDIVSQTKFDTAPTTDDSTTWEDALDTSLVRKAQVATAIAESGGGGSVPDNVYTQDNLIEGENVTFTEVPPEGGIDEHTLACWHFDGDSIDVVGNKNVSASSYNTKIYKFGTSGAKFSYAKSLLSGYSKNEITLDGWVHVDTGYIWLSLEGQAYQNYYVSGNGFRIYNNKIAFGNFTGIGMKWTEISSVDFQIPSNEMVHLAIQRTTSTTYNVWANGIKVMEVSLDSPYSDQYVSIVNSGDTTNHSVDELRISDCVRYTESFTPPTEPYKLATGPSKTAVNAVIPEVDLSGKADTDLGNISENIDYVIESYNDGTNWYRVYKSGWIEQGGYVTGAETYTLLKPMMDTNYIVLVTERDTTAPSQQEGSPRAGAISTTQIYINGGKGSLGTINYYVCGQGAE